MNSAVPNQADSSDPCRPSETAATIASYDATAAEFASRRGTLRLEHALSAFTQLLSGHRQVLDLGCGPGRDVDFLTDLDCTVVGLDLSAGMLREARKRLPRARLIQAELRSPPFASKCFDGIWASASLLHLPRAGFDRALAELVRFLREPGGVLYLALKGGQGEQWVTGGDGRWTFFAYYQSDEIEMSLTHAGFQALERWTAEDQAGRCRPWINVVARLQDAQRADSRPLARPWTGCTTPHPMVYLAAPTRGVWIRFPRPNLARRSIWTCGEHYTSLGSL